MVNFVEIMEKSVKTIRKDSTVLEASKTMAHNGITCLVVASGDSIEGIITRRDILEKVVVREMHPSQVKVEEIMTHPVITVEKNSNMVEAAELMNSHSIKQLPVVNDDRLVGIVTQTDIIRNLNNILGI